jgi:O-antigen ligase
MMRSATAQPSAAPPAAARRARAPSLLWTDAWYLCGIAIAALVATDPLELGLASHTIVKHLALAVCLGAAMLALVLRAALPHKPGAVRARPLGAPLAAAWPLALFSLMVIAGSGYLRLSGGVDNTFLNYGLYVAMMFCAAAMLLQTPAPLALLRGYFAILLGAALVMSALLIAYAGRKQVYHEQIFLVIPMAALCFAGGGPALLRWAGAAFFLALAWFSHKYTSYLVAALCAAYLAVFIWLPRLPRSGPLGRTTVAYWGVLALVAVGAAAAAFALRGGEGQPTGNPEFRLHTYGAAWQRFLDSPLWGSGFMREAAEKFSLYNIGIAGNVLPTHSDFLDLLANGGLVGFSLFLLGLGMIFARAWRELLRPAQIARPEARYGHALALLVLAALLTSCFNPILLQPPMAALAWSNLGMLLGLALRAASPPPRS